MRTVPLFTCAGCGSALYDQAALGALDGDRVLCLNCAPESGVEEAPECDGSHGGAACGYDCPLFDARNPNPEPEDEETPGACVTCGTQTDEAGICRAVETCSAAREYAAEALDVETRAALADAAPGDPFDGFDR